MMTDLLPHWYHNNMASVSRPITRVDRLFLPPDSGAGAGVSKRTASPWP